MNDLLRMWWKPFNRDKTLHIDCYDKCKWLNYKWIHLDGWFMNEESRTLRELVSIDSWLWQFVCENGMQNMIEEHREGYCSNEDYWYRLIESALLDEDKLEDFILDNVKIDE